MGKKTKRQQLNYPEVRGWIPYEAYSKNSKYFTLKRLPYLENEILKDDECDKHDVPEGWKEPPFTADQNPHGKLCAMSTFSTLFPKYREKYLKETWSAAKKILLEYHIRGELDLAESTMEVRTTPKTYDPFIILKARDFIRLLSRSVPLDQAARVLHDDVFADIIELHVRKRERFVKRRARLIGVDGETLKAIELSTGCYILMQGKTVAAVGPYNGLKQVRKVVLECMNDNIHPAYNIKRIILIQKLSTDPSKKDLSWDAFLPKIKKKVLSKRWQPKKVRTKKAYTPFPPAPVNSKIDAALEAGTYFLGEAERRQTSTLARVQASEVTSRQRQSASRAAAFLPPDELAALRRSEKEAKRKDLNVVEGDTKKKKKKEHVKKRKRVIGEEEENGTGGEKPAKAKKLKHSRQPEPMDQSQS